MCDYSLMHRQSRKAAVGDKLITTSFGFSHGLSDQLDKEVAVCLLPGTELAFDDYPQKRSWLMNIFDKVTFSAKHKVAIFRQINLDQKHTHHDAIEMPDGQTVLLHELAEGLTCTVLQLPAEPKNEAEAKAQERLEVVA